MVNERYIKLFVDYWIDLINECSYNIDLNEQCSKFFNTLEKGLKGAGCEINVNYSEIKDSYKGIADGIDDLSVLGSVLYTRLVTVERTDGVDWFAKKDNKSLFLFILNRMKQLTQDVLIMNGDIKEIIIDSRRALCNEELQRVSINHKGEVSIAFYSEDDESETGRFDLILNEVKELNISEETANEILVSLGNYFSFNYLKKSERDLLGKNREQRPSESGYYDSDFDDDEDYWTIKIIYKDGNELEYTDCSTFCSDQRLLKDISAAIRKALKMDHLFVFDFCNSSKVVDEED